MTRPEDEYPYDRNARALILRIGTVAAIAADTLTVDVPGSQLPGVAQLGGFTAAVGQRVAVLLDRDNALAVGLPSSTTDNMTVVSSASFTLSGSVSNLAHAAAFQQTFVAVTPTGLPCWRVKPGDTTTLECTRPGWYLFSAWQRCNTPTTRTTGYAQMVWTNVIDVVAAQGGSPFFDLVIPGIVQPGTPGASYRLSISNLTGAAMNINAGGRVTCVLLGPQ